MFSSLLRCSAAVPSRCPQPQRVTWSLGSPLSDSGPAAAGDSRAPHLSSDIFSSLTALVKLLRLDSWTRERLIAWNNLPRAGSAERRCRLLLPITSDENSSGPLPSCTDS